MILAACATSGPAKPVAPGAESRAAGLIPAMENAIAEKIIESTVEDIGKVDPEAGTRLGNGEHDDVWDPPGGAELSRRVGILNHYNELMQAGVDLKRLTAANKVRVKLLDYGAKREARALQYRDYKRLINPVNGPQVRLPLLLITAQPARTVQDFKDYVARLRAFAPYVDSTISISEKRRQDGKVLSTAGMRTVAAECRALTSGRPFVATGDPSPLLDDFDTRVRLAGIDPDAREALEHEASHALVDSVGPACEKLSNWAEKVGPNDTAPVSAAAHDYYLERLAWFTSTDLSPEAVYDLAIGQMSRITAEIESEMGRESFHGTTLQFMAQLRGDPKYRITDDSDTLQEWLNKTGSYIFNLDASLGDMLAPRPDTDLDVREMESFQQPSGEVASYYGTPGLGIYYVNLTAVPRYEVEAITYRYSIPGRHVIPMSPLNRVVPIPAFTDGWALYSLQLPIAFHYYSEPKTELGRLLVTAAAISEAVIDTGINARHWDRRQAMQYLLDHSTMSSAQAEKAVDRVIVDPGAATAAVVGATTIARLRDKSRQALGHAFSIKDFNRVVLQYGPVPMALLEQNVNEWLEHQVNGKIHTNQP